MALAALFLLWPAAGWGVGQAPRVKPLERWPAQPVGRQALAVRPSPSPAPGTPPHVAATVRCVVRLSSIQSTKLPRWAQVIQQAAMQPCCWRCGPASSTERLCFLIGQAGHRPAPATGLASSATTAEGSCKCEKRHSAARLLATTLQPRCWPGLLEGLRCIPSVDAGTPGAGASRMLMLIPLTLVQTAQRAGAGGHLASWRLAAAQLHNCPGRLCQCSRREPQRVLAAARLSASHVSVAR